MYACTGTVLSFKLHTYVATYNKMCLTFGNIIYQVTITSNMTAVTGWTLRYHPTSSSNDVTRQIFDADDSGYVLMGLDRGTSYTVQVAANNSIGMSSFTNQMESTLVDRK